MLGQRRRRWPNIEPTLLEGLVSAGVTVVLVLVDPLQQHSKGTIGIVASDLKGPTQKAGDVD